MSYGKSKFAEEDLPSAETNSVLFPACSPPNKRTSPDGRPQQRWFCLRSTRLTDVASNVETPSNFSQDPYVGSFPPQRRLLQKLANFLVLVISPAGQDWFKAGLNSSVASRWFPKSSFVPAAIINPPVKPGYIMYCIQIFGGYPVSTNDKESCIK